MDLTPPPDPNNLNAPPAAAWQKPADYYSGQTPPPGKSGCPKWVPITCGIVSLVLLLLIFGVGAWLVRGGANRLVSFAFSQTAGQMSSMYGSDVAPQDRERLQKDMDLLRQKTREGKVPLANIQPLLRKVQGATADNQLTPSEVADLSDTIERVTGQDRQTP